MTKVLIIEDEPLVVRMYEKSLRFEKFDVISALNGVEGLEKIRSEKPDIVLLDIMMPQMNGMQVLEEMGKDPALKDIPVIMLTNLSGDHDAELALSKGALQYWIKKDAKPQELGTRITEALNKTSKE